MIPNYLNFIPGKTHTAWLLTLLLLCNLPITVQASSSRYTSEDFSHWLEMAYIADAAYKSAKDVEQVLSSQGYKLNQFK